MKFLLALFSIMRKIIIVGGGSLIGLIAGVILSEKSISTVGSVNEVKAVVRERKNKKIALINTITGLDDDLIYPGNYGMSPKDYGLEFGSGLSRKHSNRLRLAHNAKIKRRKK